MRSKMSSCSFRPSLTLLLVLCTVMWVDVEARSITLPSPQCRAGVVEQMSARIQQICKALKAIREFSNVMENYLDERVLEETLGLPLTERHIMEELRSHGVDVKRHKLGESKKKDDDVSHVFLHFGKRTFPF